MVFTGVVGSRGALDEAPPKGATMEKIPAPKIVGDCTSVGGITLCPHLAHLTKPQIAKVREMHNRNVSKIAKSKKAAKAKASKTKKKAKHWSFLKLEA